MLLQGSGGTTSHEMVIRSFDVPTKCDHCTSFMQGQVRQGMTCKGGLRRRNLLGRDQGSSGDCLGRCWEGNSVWQDNGQGVQNVLQSLYPPV